MRSLVFLFRALTPVGFLLAAVAGCGGGGGGGGAADVAPSNARPSVAALDDRTLTAGERVDIQVSVTDANTADTHSLSASSSDTEVATVSVSGTTLTVSAVAAGNATITVTVRDNSGAANAESEPATFDVAVTASNARPSVAALSDRTLSAGKRVDIQVSVTDTDAADTHSLSASSSDTDVATVSVSGTTLTVSAVGAGTATITVTARDNSGAANAESEPVTFDVTVEDDWVKGVFQPASLFKDFCANPRQPDPMSGETFPDMRGEIIDENNWLRSWSNDTYLWYDEIVDQNPALYSTSEYFALLKTMETTPLVPTRTGFTSRIRPTNGRPSPNLESRWATVRVLSCCGGARLGRRWWPIRNRIRPPPPPNSRAERESWKSTGLIL